jgi:hypothetical protein
MATKGRQGNIPKVLQVMRDHRLGYWIRLFRDLDCYMFVALSRDSDERIDSRLKAIRKLKPFMFCINDAVEATYVPRNKMVRLLGDIYPKPAALEL